MVNSTFPRPIGIDSSLCLLSQHTWRRILPRPIGIDSPLCLLSQHTWRRILPRRCHLDRRRGGCCPATATGANPHHVRRRPERLNCCRPSPFSVACPVLPFVSLTLRYTRLFDQLSRAESKKSINQVRAVPFQDKSKVTSISKSSVYLFFQGLYLGKEYSSSSYIVGIVLSIL